jgi:hypothetical protein
VDVRRGHEALRLHVDLDNHGLAAGLRRRLPEHEARLLGASAAMFQRMEAPIPDDERDEHERTRARLALTFDDAALNRLIAEGAAAPQEATIDEALASTR